MKKVLIISRAYIHVGAYDQFEYLCNSKEYDVTLVLPSKMGGSSTGKTFKEHSADDLGLVPDNVIKSKLVFLKKHSSLSFYFPIFKYLMKIKPDIIHLEEEPWNLQTFHIVMLAKLFLPKTKIVFFTWENIYYKRPFPLSFFEKFTLKNVDYAICGNEEAKRILLMKKFQKPIKVMAQWGVKTDMFKKEDGSELRKSLGLRGFVISFIGRFIESKGIDILIEAAAKLDGDFTLLLIGGGPYENQMLKLAEDLGVKERIKIIPPTEYHDLPPYFTCMDALVLPSKTTKQWKEQFGHILIEAMSAEVPVIGSDSGAIPEVIGDAGLIFKENSYEDLSHKLLKLMAHEDIRENLISKGKKRVKEEYSMEKVSSGMKAIWAELSKK